MDNVNVKLLKELTRGIESASQLCVLISDQSRTKNQLRNNNEKLISCMKHESSNILSSFDNAISMLRQITQLKYFNHNNVCEDSYNSSKIKHSNKRSYSTRNINSKPVKIVNSHMLAYDGYTWRKYGQKPIVNDKHPREYYRCGYKNKGCHALKHVQVTSENPIKYKTTYFGQHTCHSIIKNNVTHFDLLDYSDQKEYHSTNILSFEPPLEPEDESIQIKKKHKVIDEEKKCSGCNDMPSSSSLVSTPGSPSSIDLDLMDMECLFSPQWVENNYGSVDQVDGGFQDFQLWNE